MAIPCYLAMTGAEFHAASTLPENLAWMACHFSSYSTGISNLPTDLPAGSMVILNDRIPFQGHDPQRILVQMQQIVEDFCPTAILLDFQRPQIPTVAAIAKLLAETLPCPVGVTEPYAENLSCPVFLEAPIHRPLTENLSPWEGREIWLDMVPMGGTITVKADSSDFQPGFPAFDEEYPVFADEALCCRYQTQIGENYIRFLLRRDRQEMSLLIDAGEKLGVTRAIGLYQQLEMGSNG